MGGVLLSSAHGSRFLDVEQAGGVLVVRFNQPAIRSPLSVRVLEALDEVLDSVGSAVVFTGVDNGFASGADLREIASLSSGEVRAFAERGQRLMNKIAALSQPTVAAVNGYCFGGALDLALACRRRIASPGAKFAHPGAGLGIITGWGGTQRLPRLVGTANALEMLFTASPIDAHRALHIGLVDEVVDDPLDAALKFVG